MTAAVGQVIRQLLLLCYYNYLIGRAVIMSVFLKRHASKLIHLEALYHQSLLHRSHTPYQAPPHKDTVELLLWDTPIQGTLPFKRHESWSQSGGYKWVPKSSFIFYSGDTLALKRYICNRPQKGLISVH